jgi:hypothetical protein
MFSSTTVGSMPFSRKSRVTVRPCYGSGNGDATYGEQLLEMELQADAEHQEDDADFGELLGQVGIGGEDRRVRSDGDPGKEIADDWREAETLGDVPRDERRRQSSGESRDQLEVMHKEHPPQPGLPWFPKLPGCPSAVMPCQLLSRSDSPNASLLPYPS